MPGWVKFVLLASGGALLWVAVRSQQRSVVLVEGGIASSPQTPGHIFDGLGRFPEALGDVVEKVGEVIGGVLNRSRDQVIEAWAAAIQKHEGWYPGSRAYRNNNPGNLNYAGQRGATGVDVRSGPYRGQVLSLQAWAAAGKPVGFAVFPTHAAGFDALKRDLRAKLTRWPTYTIAQVMAVYAPASENDTARYAQVVAAALGASPATTVQELFG